MPFSSAVTDARGVEAGREDVETDGPAFGVEGDQVHLFDRLIFDGDAADAGAAAVQVDVAARPPGVTAEPVAGVGVRDLHRQVVARIRVERGHLVEAFGHLRVALFPFRPEVTGRSAERVRLHQRHRLALLAGPQLELTLLLEGAQVDLIHGVREAGFLHEGLHVDGAPRADLFDLVLGQR